MENLLKDIEQLEKSGADPKNALDTILRVHGPRFPKLSPYIENLRNGPEKFSDESILSGIRKSVGPFETVQPERPRIPYTIPGVPRRTTQPGAVQEPAPAPPLMPAGEQQASEPTTAAPEPSIGELTKKLAVGKLFGLAKTGAEAIEEVQRTWAKGEAEFTAQENRKRIAAGLKPTPIPPIPSPAGVTPQPDEGAEVPPPTRMGETAVKLDKIIKENFTPQDLQPQSPKYYYYSAIKMLADVAPHIALQMATGGIYPAVVGMGGEVFINKKKELMRAGFSEQDSNVAAGIHGAAMGVGKAIPLHVMFKSPAGTSFLRRFVNAAIPGAPVMAVMTGVQSAVDQGTINPDMTLEEFGQNMLDAQFLNLVMGGAAASMGIPGARRFRKKEAQQKALKDVVEKIQKEIAGAEPTVQEPEGAGTETGAPRTRPRPTPPPREARMYYGVRRTAPMERTVTDQPPKAGAGKEGIVLPPAEQPMESGMHASKITEAALPKPPKENWQMTGNEYIEDLARQREKVIDRQRASGIPVNPAFAVQAASIRKEINNPASIYRGHHKSYVQEALAQGKKVPTEVLKDYPELPGKMMGAEPPKPARVETTEIVPGAEQSKKDKARDYLGKMIEKRIKLNMAEELGQDILDVMESQGRSPIDVSKEFWEDTYWKLDSLDQVKFQKQVRAMTGVEGREFNNKVDPLKLADEYTEALPTEVKSLEDIERGYVSLMEWANLKHKEIIGKETTQIIPGSERLRAIETTVIPDEMAAARAAEFSEQVPAAAIPQERQPATFIGMQEAGPGKEPYPLVNLKSGTSVAYNPEIHDLTNPQEYNAARVQIVPEKAATKEADIRVRLKDGKAPEMSGKIIFKAGLTRSSEAIVEIEGQRFKVNNLGKLQDVGLKLERTTNEDSKHWANMDLSILDKYPVLTIADFGGKPIKQIPRKGIIPGTREKAYMPSATGVRMMAEPTGKAKAAPGLPEAPKAQEGAGGGKAGGPKYPEGEFYKGPQKVSKIELPEVVELFKELSGGKYPEVWKKFAGRLKGSLGGYVPNTGKVKVLAELGKDPENLASVLSHEIGHFIDHIPDQILKKFPDRGNILGRIASLKKYTDEFLAEYPGSPAQPLTPQDIAALHQEAQRQAQAGKPGQALTPQDVIDIWNSLEKKNPKLEDYIKGLTDKQKADIVRNAMKGKIPNWVTFRYGEIQDANVKDIFDKMVASEIAERRLYENQIVETQLKELSELWRPWDRRKESPAYAKYRDSSEELYADAFSALMNDPNLLKSMAPDFAKGFFAYLERKPEVKRLYEGIQSRITAGPEAVAETRRASREAGYVAGEAQEKKKPVIPELKQWSWVNIANKFSDRTQGILREANSKNVKYALEDMLYQESEREAYFKEHAEKILTPMDKMGVKYDDFRDYLFLRETAMQPEGREKAAPGGTTKKTAQDDLAMMEKEVGPETFANMEKLRKDFWDIRKTYLIDKVIESGMFNEKLNKMLNDNQYYVTHDVVKEWTKSFGSNSGFYIHPRMGTFHDIKDPFMSTIMKDLSLMRAVNYKYAAATVIKDLQSQDRGLVKKAQSRWNGRFWQVQDTTEQGWGTVKFLENGRLVGYDLPKYMVDAFKRNPIESNLITRILSSMNKPFRELFIQKRPGFWGFNAIRDFFDALLYLKGDHPIKWAQDWAHAIIPSYKGVKGFEPRTQEASRMKALISSVDYTGETTEDRQLDRFLLAHGYKKPLAQNKVFKAMDDLVHKIPLLESISPGQKLYAGVTRLARGMNVIAATVERIPKLAAVEYLRREFPDMKEAEIAYRVRRTGSPPFLIKGELTPLTNQILWLSNAMVQGTKVQIEAAKEQKAIYAYKVAKYTILPKLIMASFLWGWWGDKPRRIMESQTNYTKDNYYVLPLGETDSGKGVALTIPPDQNTRLLSGLFWKILTKGIHNPKDMMGLMDYTSNQFPGINPAISMVDDVATYMGGNNPYDRFRQKPAIPESIFKLPDSDPRKISYFAKYLSNKSGFGILYKFSNDEPEQIKGELETIIGAPVIGDVVGRFIRVTNYGIAEKERKKAEPIAAQEAKSAMDARQAVTKILNGKAQDLTPEEIQGLATHSDKITQQVMKQMAHKAALPYLEAFLKAPSKSQKAAVLQSWAQEMATRRQAEKEGRSGWSIPGVRFPK